MSAPERIWLQDAGDYALARKAGADLTWCDSPIDEADREYVRADRLTEAVEALRRVDALLPGWMTAMADWDAGGEAALEEMHDVRGEIEELFVRMEGKP